MRVEGRNCCGEMPIGKWEKGARTGNKNLVLWTVIFGGRDDREVLDILNEVILAVCSNCVLECRYCKTKPIKSVSVLKSIWDD